MSEKNKPLDILSNSLGQSILLRIRGNHEIKGILRSYDIHLNLYLEDTVLLGVKKGDYGAEEDLPEERLGKVILRGDNVIMISPP